MDAFLFTQSSTAKFCVKCRRFNALNSCTCESTSFFLFFLSLIIMYFVISKHWGL